MADVLIAIGSLTLIVVICGLISAATAALVLWLFGEL